MKLDAYHQNMRDKFVVELRQLIDGKSVDSSELDELLNACPARVECCDQCAEIFCPYGELLHFHHDGCPCCSMRPVAYSDDRSRYKMLLERNTRKGSV